MAAGKGTVAKSKVMPQSLTPEGVTTAWGKSHAEALN